MNNNFSIARLGKMIGYDLKNIWRGYCTTIVALALMPVSLCFLYGLPPFLLGFGWHFPGVIVRSVVSFVAMIIFVMSFPATCYGYITDKSKGTAYLMIPVSTLEKFLSMFLCSVIIVPALFSLAYFTSDWLLSLLSFNQGSGLFAEAFQFMNWPELKGIHFLSITFAGLGSFILPLLLGAIWFNRRKISMTVLALLAIQSVLHLFFGSMSLQILRDSSLSQDFFVRFPDLLPGSAGFAHMVNTTTFISLAIEYVVFGLLIYFRIKNLKH